MTLVVLRCTEIITAQPAHITVTNLCSFYLAASAVDSEYYT